VFGHTVTFAAGLPPGVINIVNGRGDVVGAEITRNPDIAKISFTGSTAVGKSIATGAETVRFIEFSLHGLHVIALTSLLLMYVQICGTVARVISNKPR
jgi:hypothetical protein